MSHRPPKDRIRRACLRAALAGLALAAPAVGAAAAPAHAATGCPNPMELLRIDLEGPGIPGLEFENPVTGPLPLTVRARITNYWDRDITSVTIDWQDGTTQPIPVAAQCTIESGAVQDLVTEQVVSHIYTHAPDPSKAILTTPRGSYYYIAITICRAGLPCFTRDDDEDALFFPSGAPASPPVLEIGPPPPSPTRDRPDEPHHNEPPALGHDVGATDCGTVKVGGRTRRVYAHLVDCATARKLAKRRLRGFVCRYSGGPARSRFGLCRPRGAKRADEHYVYSPPRTGKGECSPVAVGGARWKVTRKGVTCRYARATVRRIIKGQTPAIWEFTNPSQGFTGRWRCERFGTDDGRYGACVKRVENRWISFDPLGRR